MASWLTLLISVSVSKKIGMIDHLTPLTIRIACFEYSVSKYPWRLWYLVHDKHDRIIALLLFSPFGLPPHINLLILFHIRLHFSYRFCNKNSLYLFHIIPPYLSSLTLLNSNSRQSLWFALNPSATFLFIFTVLVHPYVLLTL